MSAGYLTFSLDRMVSAVEKVRDRLLRSTAALEEAGIDYAVAGDNAVAAWVTRVDEAAVRNTQDVDVLICRKDLAKVTAALEGAGFVYRHIAGMDIFLDGPDSKVRDAVHIVFSGERVRAHEALPNPEVTEFVNADGYRILTLEALVGIKLTAFRDKDRVHLRDLLEVGLIDSTWLTRFPAALAERLQRLIDTPEG